MRRGVVLPRGAMVRTQKMNKWPKCEKAQRNTFSQTYMFWPVSRIVFIQRRSTVLRILVVFKGITVYSLFLAMLIFTSKQLTSKIKKCKPSIFSIHIIHHDSPWFTPQQKNPPVTKSPNFFGQLRSLVFTHTHRSWLINQWFPLIRPAIKPLFLGTLDVARGGRLTN